MSRGRPSAVALSLGVVTGSMFWGCFAAFGFVAAIKASAELFTAMKLAGGCYLLYLAFKSWRSAMAREKPQQVQAMQPVSIRRCFVQGLLIHLTNPKAPLVWLATLSVGMGNTAPLPLLMLTVLLCAFMAMIVFVGYAFSVFDNGCIEVLHVVPSSFRCRFGIPVRCSSHQDTDCQGPLENC